MDSQVNYRSFNILLLSLQLNRLIFARYWDWSLDWMNLANSSIWDSSTGFGGDGDLDSPVTVGEGRCVTDGPFSELRPIIYNHTYTRHCLSRGFRDGKAVGRLPGRPYSPESIGSILREPTYKEFVRRVENYLHNTMHQAIAGDFLAMTAANGKWAMVSIFCEGLTADFTLKTPFSLSIMCSWTAYGGDGSKKT